MTTELILILLRVRAAFITDLKVVTVRFCFQPCAMKIHFDPLTAMQSGYTVFDTF